MKLVKDINIMMFLKKNWMHTKIAGSKQQKNMGWFIKTIICLCHQRIRTVSRNLFLQRRKNDLTGITIKNRIKPGILKLKKGAQKNCLSLSFTYKNGNSEKINWNFYLAIPILNSVCYTANPFPVMTPGISLFSNSTL